MAKYKVTSRIKRGGKYYEPGEVIKLPQADAAAMPHAVKEIVEEALDEKDEAQKKKGKGTEEE